MWLKHLELLVCPECQGELRLRDARESQPGCIESGTLRCGACATEWPILRSVPRFVPLENYASGFGLQWTKHARTQYDSHSGTTVSEQRFFASTGWPRDMRGELLLEVGSGSGRFTEQAAQTEATVVSLDYSYAVDANFAGNGHRENVLIVQADMYRMPFRPASFDRVCCLGVLQHTPDVRRSFLALPPMVRPGGSLAVDVYRRYGWWKQRLVTKYWVRPLTRRMNPAVLYRLVGGYVRLMWPITKLVHRLPLGRQINWAMLIADYRDVLPLTEQQLREWAVLDTFDMLAPAYDTPQTLDSVREWFSATSLENVEVHYGHNGIEARATTPIGVASHRRAG